MTNLVKRLGMVVVAACLAALSPSIAAAALEWDDTTFIVEKLQVYKGGRVWVHLNKPVTTSACTSNSTVQIHPSASTEGRELMMKVLVAAQLSGRPVELRVDYEDSVCMLYEVTMH